MAPGSMEEPEAEEPPSSSLLTDWARAAYANVSTDPAEVTIRLVDKSEMRTLNRDYRGRDKATNVLSFPFRMEAGADPGLDFSLLGDIVICHPVVRAEALTQQKSVADHYAHMVTHGMLHLCGYDHQQESDAQRMEALETRILEFSGIADPYT
ncbi:MAG: rRNA maturation RNase YbeY [Gammaproteobacteria bacterium]|nr:rRNA maturation RNase YbeY [Gammaproteobacteria bacterium]